MSNAPYPPNPYGPGFPPPPSGGGCGKFMLGCGLILSTFMILVAVGLYLAWPRFVSFAVQTTLYEMRDDVRKMNNDPNVRDELANDFDRVRISVTEENKFEFFQFLAMAQEIQKQMADGTLDPHELASLRSELDRMKKIQGIDGK